MTIIDTCTEAIYRETVAGTDGGGGDYKRVFYQGMEMEFRLNNNNKQCQRRVYVGDVVAIACPDDFETPYHPKDAVQKKKAGQTFSAEHPLGQPWKVGLVLALWQTVPHIDLQVEPTYDMTVLWLHRYVHLPPSLKSIHAQMKKSVRPTFYNSLLLESSDIQSNIPVHRILPPLIQLGEKTEMKAHDHNNNTDQTTIMVLHLCCQYRFCGPDKMEKTQGWESYNSSSSTTTTQTTNNNNNNNMDPPPFLVQAWHDPQFPWHENKVFLETQQRFYKHYAPLKLQDRRVAMMEQQQMMIKTRTTKEEQPGAADETAKQQQQGKRQPKSMLQKKATANKENNNNNKSSKSKPTAVTTTTSKTKKKAVLKKQSKSKSSGKGKVVKAAASKPKAKAPVSKSKAKAAKSSSTKKPAANGKKRKSRQANTTAKATKKKARVAKDDEIITVGEDSTSSSSNTSAATTSVNGVVPLEPSRKVHKEMTCYYDGVVLPWDMQQWDSTVRTNAQKTEHGTWTFHVGDVIAVACQESQKPTSSSSSSPWFPYSVPWRPALVLAVFHDRNRKPHESAEWEDFNFSHYQMVIRFFHRWNDLEKEVQELILEEDPDAARHLQSDIYAVVETSDEKDMEDFSVTAALGKLSFTTLANSSAAESLILQPNMPPSVAIQCQYQLYYSASSENIAESSSLCRVNDDWIHHYTNHKNALKAFRRLEIKIPGVGIEFYRNAIKKRWSMMATDDDDRRKPPRGKKTASSASQSTASTAASTYTSTGRRVPSFIWDPATWKAPSIAEDGTWAEGGEGAMENSHFCPLRHSKRIYDATGVVSMEEDSDENTMAPVSSFYDSLEVPLLTSRFTQQVAASVIKKLDGRNTTTFTVKVGDVVCVAMSDNEAGELCNSKGVKNNTHYFPYQGPWKIGQVMTIYSRPSKIRRTRRAKEIQTESPYLEIRWLPRISELPQVWQNRLEAGPLAGSPLWKASRHPGNGSIATHDVLESDVVERDVPASCVLGPVGSLQDSHGVELDSKNDNAVMNGRRRKHKHVSPMIRCNLHTLFYWKVQRTVQPVYTPFRKDLPAERNAVLAKERFLRRGLYFSACLNTYTELMQIPTYKQNEASVLQISSNADNLSTTPMWVESVNSGDAPRREVYGAVDIIPPEREYYGVVDITPPWDCYSKSLCIPIDRRGLNWTVRVGDVVAVRDAVSEDDDHPGVHFPFTVPWKAAQIVAIFKDPIQAASETESETKKVDNVFSVELRMFRQLSGDILQETNDLLTYSHDRNEQYPSTIDLLGPVVLYPDEKDILKKGEAVLQHHPHLPVVSFAYGGRNNASQQESQGQLDFLGIVKRGVYLSSHYDSDQRREQLVDLFAESHLKQLKEQQLANTSLFQQFMGDIATNSGTSVESFWAVQEGSTCQGDEESEVEKRIKVPSTPIHFDKSARRAYFDKVLLEPAYDNMAIFSADGEEKQSWEVKLGDLVAVHYDGNYRSAGPAYFEPCAKDYRNVKRDVSTYYPFAAGVPWGVAEVVCIWTLKDEDGDNEDELYNLASRSFTSNRHVEVEVRWFYRKKEVPGFSGESSEALNGSSELLEEVLESDHIEDVPALSLLAPVSLHPTPARHCPSQFKIGMPILDFFCRRFFSIVRKSLLPCGGIDGRVTRGRFHSRYIRDDAVLREMLCDTGVTRQQSTPIASQVGESDWNEAYSNVIQKLSLTDASKESSECIMIGREKEQEKILSFLTGAIRGGTGATGSSMFVAGPPGVGKTGCIRAAIAKLQRDQASGLIPAFRFIALNGMEMRHPFEAYIRLLEAVKGGTKVRKSEEEAAAGLEKYFTTTAGLQEDEDEIVTVVLLDEIDYLVTQKQTVMYNFFDWPRRSAALHMEEGRGRRLVVVGVSNTLNLPERLQPRVQSRIGNTRCYFKSYDVKAIHSILKSKIEQAAPFCAVFEEDAIVFAARKTAAVSGDVRKAFHICRSAAEMVLNKHLQSQSAVASAGQEGRPPLVRIPDVQRVSREASDSGHAKAIAQSTPFEALLIISLASLSRSTGRECNGFDIEEILTKMDAIAGAFGDDQYTPSPRLEETLFMLSRLAEAQIVKLETPTNASLSFRSSLAGMGGSWPIASLKVDETNLLNALRGTKHNELAQKYLTRS